MLWIQGFLFNHLAGSRFRLTSDTFVQGFSDQVDWSQGIGHTLKLHKSTTEIRGRFRKTRGYEPLSSPTSQLPALTISWASHAFGSQWLDCQNRTSPECGKRGVRLTCCLMSTFCQWLRSTGYLHPSFCRFAPVWTRLVRSNGVS